MIPINSLICGDCRKYLPKIDSNTIDLVYMDPPFGSTSTDKQFGLKWKNVEEYIEWMKPIIVELHRVLKSTGSLYLHCDYHANAYIRVKILDKIFGYNNFRNEIVWKRSNAKNHATRKFNENIDSIFFYTNSNDYIFNVQYDKQDAVGTQPIVSLLKSKYFCEPGTRYFRDINKTITINDGIHGWRWSQEKINIWIEQGKTFDYSCKYPRFFKGDKKPSEDIWLNMYAHPSSKERLGYPTQKSEKLLERIIKASSNVGDIVLDPFCGCGTTLSVASQLGRQFIGVDISDRAIEISKKRLNDLVNK
jgi:DNA modification methylase